MAGLKVAKKVGKFMARGGAMGALLKRGKKALKKRDDKKSAKAVQAYKESNNANQSPGDRLL